MFSFFGIELFIANTCALTFLSVLVLIALETNSLFSGLGI